MWCSTEGRALLLQWSIVLHWQNLFQQDSGLLILWSELVEIDARSLAKAKFLYRTWETLSLRSRFHDLCSRTKQASFPRHMSWLLSRSPSSLLSHTVHLFALEGEWQVSTSFLTSSQSLRYRAVRQCHWTIRTQKPAACAHLSWGAQAGCALLLSGPWEQQQMCSHPYAFCRVSISVSCQEHVELGVWAPARPSAWTLLLYISGAIGRRVSQWDINAVGSSAIKQEAESWEPELNT